MSTFVVYVDLAVPGRNVNVGAAQLASESGVVDLVYTELQLSDGEEGLSNMLNSIDAQLESLNGNYTSVLIIGDFTSEQSFVLDELLDGKSGYTFISMTSSSPLMSNLNNGFGVHSSDLHTISSMILLTEPFYSQVLIMVDGRYGVDMYNLYKNSISSQNVRLFVVGEATNMQDISEYMNDPQTYVISTLLGPSFDQMMDLVEHERVLSYNSWVIDESKSQHLNVRPAAPFPEKSGISDLEGMTTDLLEFAGRVKKIEGWTFNRIIMIGLWNQFVTDTRTPLAFFRNVTVDPTLNTPRLFGANLVSNKELIKGVDIELFNENNVEPFSQSVASIRVRHPSRTQLEYWNNIKITLLSIENIHMNGQLAIQRFNNSITKVPSSDPQKILYPNPSYWDLEASSENGRVTSATSIRVYGDDIFCYIPTIIDRHLYTCSGVPSIEPVQPIESSNVTSEIIDFYQLLL